MTDQPTTETLRDQYAAAIRKMLRDYGEGDYDPGTGSDYGDQTAVVLDIRDREMEQLRVDLDRVQERACYTAELLRHAEKRTKQVEAALRDAAPILRGALDCLDATCRYHGDRLDPDEYGRRVRSEACCDTGIAPRRAREAKTALARMRAALDESQQ